MASLALPGGIKTEPPKVPLELRFELSLRQVEPDADGAPAWVLHDPLTNKFFRLGSFEVEVLRFLPLGSPGVIAEAASRALGRAIGEDDVRRLIGFLGQHNLIRMIGPAGRARYDEGRAKARRASINKMIGGWTYLRLPLLRPDHFLQRTLPYLAWWFRAETTWAIGAVALLALLLLSHQTDAFFATFSHFFNLEGAIWYALTLASVKVLHEFGHAYTCKWYGGRVPSMGIALMVFWPVLFTDTTDSWKLPSSRQRFAIGIAGIKVEMALAALSLLLWSFLPDGVLRSACFLVGSTTWVMTLLVNLNPLMRFDGYYLMSDLLRVPNLQDRSYALARWRLRELAFGFGDSPPEPPIRGLITFGVATYIYRLSVTLGIAVLVYHFIFKSLGVLLAVIILWNGLLRPAVREVRDLAGKKHRFNRRVATALALAVLTVGVFIVPWRGSVTAPALYGASNYASIFMPADGRLARLLVAPGERIIANGPVMTLETPDLSYQVRQADLEVEAARIQMASQGLDRNLLDRSAVLGAELHAAVSRRDGLRAQVNRATPAAPFAGMAVDFSVGLAPGDWLGEGEYILSIAAPAEGELVAYVEEAELGRLAVGARGTFYPVNGAAPPFQVRIKEIEIAATRELDQPIMASVHGGPVPVRQVGEGRLVPQGGLYRVRLLADAPVMSWQRVISGSVRLDAESASLLGNGLRHALGVFRREFTY